MVKPYRHHVFVCTASGAGDAMDTPADPARCRYCSDKGGEAVRTAFWDELERAGVDDVKVTRMGCTVQHKCGPVVLVYPEGVWYGAVGTGDIAEIVAGHLVGGQPVARLVIHRLATPLGEEQEA